MRRLGVLSVLIASAATLAWHEDIGGSSSLAGFGPDAGSRFGVAPTVFPVPYFDVTFDTGGPTLLTDSLTVGASSLDLVVGCDLPERNVSGGTWRCRKPNGPVTFSEAGSGASPSLQISPFADNSKWLYTNRLTGKHFEVADSSLNIGTEDFVLEVLYMLGEGATAAQHGCFSDKSSAAATAPGWGVMANASSNDNVNIYISDGTNQVQVTAYSTTAGGTVWNATKHLMCFVGRSGASLTQCFGNGIAGAAATSTNTLGSLANTTTTKLMRGTGASTCYLAAARLWKCNGCLTNTANYAPVAEQRSAAVFGVVPDIYAGTSSVVPFSRGSTAYVERYDAYSGTRKLFQMGASWPRLGTRLVGTNVVTGFQAESQFTNLTAYSTDISNAYWTKSNASVTADAVQGPDAEPSAADLLTVTGTGTVSYTRSITGIVASTSYTQSVFLKRVDANSPTWVQMTAPASATCVDASATNGAYFNVDTCTVGTVPANTAYARAVSYGNGWCRIQATIKSAASGTSACTPGLAIVDSDGGSTWTGATSGVGLYVWGNQFEAARLATSFIKTTTASATRTADALRYHESNITGLGGQSFTMESAVLCPQTQESSSGFFVSLLDSVNLSSAIHQKSTASASSPPGYAFGAYNNATAYAITATGTNLDDGARHVMRTTLATNDINFYYDGTLAGTDTSASLPANYAAGAFYVGASTSGSSQPQCLIDRVRLWNGVVTPAVSP